MSDHPADHDERRATARTPLVLKVEYQSKAEFLQDYTANVSQGGTMLRTDRRLVVGEKIELQLSFPGLLPTISLRGVVRWVKPEHSAENSVGIQFVHDDEDQTAALNKLVAQISAGDADVVMPDVVRVLVVEDNPHVALLIRQGLDGLLKRSAEKMAFEVLHAADGNAAWMMLKEGQYDLLITDVLLPGIDGEELTLRVRCDDRMCKLPIIAVSCGGGDIRQRMLRAGADFFLSKPFRLRDLLQTMRFLLASCQETLPPL